MVEEHYHQLSALFPDLIKPLYLDGGITLGHYPSTNWRIVISHHGTFRREGELDISVVSELGLLLYSCAFSLAGTVQQPDLVIGAVQRPEPSVENAQDIVKEMTKEAYGLRPKSLVVQLALVLAEVIGACRVLAVKKNAHVYQAKRFSKKQRAKIHTDYDELWAEFGAMEHDANFVKLCPMERKPLEDIVSKKRSMYRRRYEWLDGLERNIRSEFTSAKRYIAA